MKHFFRQALLPGRDLNITGNKKVRKRIPGLLFAIIFALPLAALAQRSTGDSILAEVTLQNAVDYAIRHQPLIQQSLLDEQITETAIRNKLADWYPQVNFNYGLQHNFLLPTAIISGTPTKSGLNNTSSGQFTVSQIIFDRDVLLAKRTGADVRLQARQTTISNKIDVQAAVSKAFYDVLATLQQISVSQENISRLQSNLKDAYNQYQAGIVDKTDYKRATISLNNAKADEKRNEEELQAKEEYLKSLMGYPVSGKLNIIYDSLQMEKQIALDTLLAPDYTTRIEYRLLSTQKRLLMSNLAYAKWAYLPSVSADGAYNLNYQNNQFGKLYATNYPNSFAGLSLSFPIFQGGKRKVNIEAAQLQLKKNDVALVDLQHTVNAEYAAAMAAYKSNLSNFMALKENVALAQEVYDVIELQYRSGIKAYLEVITAQSDLRNAQINYYNALYELLASKIDVEKALGQITY